MMSALEKIDFHGDSVWAGEVDGTVIVAVKPIVENLGLDWEAQRQRVMRDDILSGFTCIIQVDTPAGPRDTVGLPLSLLPGFLFGISTNAIADPDTRARVLAYKRECHEVLYRHFMGAAEAGEDPTEDWEWPVLRHKLLLVREARLTVGQKAARTMWEIVGLPEIEAVSREARRSQERSLTWERLDIVRQFIEERVVEAPGGRVQPSALHEAYSDWAAANGGQAIPLHALGRVLDIVGVARGRTGAGRYYLGIRLRHANEIEE